METSRTALLAGATGLTGGHLLSQLLADGRYARVIALVRKAALPVDPKLLELVVDFDTLAAPPSTNDAYCCLGTTIKQAGSQAAFRKVDVEFVIRFARAARQAGAKRFLVISSLGANARSAFFYSRVKGEMENALREIGFETLHIFQPSFILGERKQQRRAERIGISAFSTISGLLLGPMRKYRPVESATMARAMIKAAFSDSPTTSVYQSDRIETMGGR